jgi:hypothetical protein
LKCLECSNAESNVESSIIAERNVLSNDINSNSLYEETGAISDKNARLKVLLQTGMFKSLKGHQTLCDVLKKSILCKNPRKEGVGFERKLNENGTYWEPEQYPRTVWVPAKSKMLVPALLSGYDCPIPEYAYDDSLDNYKLVKNQCGKAFARYVGPNSRNGPPKKTIWVPKETIEALPITAMLTMQAENARYILDRMSICIPLLTTIVMLTMKRRLFAEKMKTLQYDLKSWSKGISRLSILIQNCNWALSELGGLEDQRPLSTPEANFRRMVKPISSHYCNIKTNTGAENQAISCAHH